MGTGVGGSLKNNKRTGGGIKPSSALQMSKVGEGEAKHGVLGSLKLGTSEMGTSVPEDFLSTEAQLTAKKIGGQAGSNPGGTYVGEDGKTRYVKFYKSKDQAYAEAVANKIYQELGISAPNTVLFSPGDNSPKAGSGIANEYVDGEPLYNTGVTPKTAQKILQGAAADILVNNWDPVGLENDNILISPEGEPIRIDNGGSFMFRARGSKKPEAMLNGIPEWDIFSGKKPGVSISTSTYPPILEAAGVKNFEDMPEQMQEQVRQINALAARSNNFEDVVPETDGVNPKTRAQILEMLRSRHKLLNEKTGMSPEDVGETEASEDVDIDKLLQEMDDFDIDAGIEDTDLKEPEATSASSEKSQTVENNPATSSTLELNAKERNMTPDEWKAHLQQVSSKMVQTSEDGGFAMSDEEFNKEIGNTVIQNMQKQRDSGVRKGGLIELPNKGKTFVIGDSHERFDNVLAIFQQIQSGAETNLDQNPDNKIVFNGDAIFPSKKHEEQLGKKDSLRGEGMLRLIGFLMARYPDQVFMTNGNHEMGALYDIKVKEDPAWQSKQPNYNGLGHDDPREGLGISNIKFALDLIKNNGIMVKIGDKEKGEPVRIIAHAAGPDMSHGKVPFNPHFTQVAAENDPMEWREKFYSIYDGWSELNPQFYEKIRKQMGADKVYFGHVAPTTMQKLMKRGESPAIEKRNSPVGEFKGGGVFVDSQTNSDLSGYIEIDLDANKETTHTMDKVLAHYKPDKMFEALKRMANISQDKATTDNNQNWLA